MAMTPPLNWASSGRDVGPFALPPARGGRMQPRHSIRGGKDYNPSPQSFASRDRTEAIPTSVSNRPAHRWRHRIFVGYVALMVLVFLVPVPAAPLAESN